MHPAPLRADVDVDDAVAVAPDATDTRCAGGCREDRPFRNAWNADIRRVAMAVLRSARTRTMARRHHWFSAGLFCDMGENGSEFFRKTVCPDTHPLHGIKCSIVVSENVASAFLAFASFCVHIEPKCHKAGKRDAKNDAHDIPRDETVVHDGLTVVRGEYFFSKKGASKETFAQKWESLCLKG